MDPTTVNGIPAHPLVVDAVIVLVPLAALLLVVCAAWPSVMRRRVPARSRSCGAGDRSDGHSRGRVAVGARS